MDTYRERVRWPVWLHLLVGLAVCFIGGIGLLGLLRDGPGWSVALSGAVALSVGYVWWRVRYLDLEIGPAGAAFGFGGLRRRVPRARLRSAAPEDYSVARYMGWGYRIGWRPGERAYSVLGHGRGVRLVFEDENGRTWDVFLSCGDPEAAVAALG